ncbi:MAG: GAF domain-containing protein, partial [Chloroflexota bacterium]|nr:GAF domain-containing protein [Chloroflexota bacterium]
MNFWKRNLRVRLIGYFLLLALITASVGPILTFTLTRNALQKSIFEQLRTATTLKEGELNRWVNDNKQDVVFLAQLPTIRTQAEILLNHKETEPEFQDGYATLSEYLAKVLAQNSELSEIFILTHVGGKIILSTSPAREGEYRVTDTYFTEGRQDTYVQNVYPSSVSGEPTMTIATPLHDKQGHHIGVLATHINLERLDHIILECAGLGASGETYLVDQFSTFVSEARFGHEDFPRGVHTTGIDAALQGNDGSGIYQNYQGTPVIGVYTWLEEHDMALMAEISQEEVFAPAQRLAFIILGVGLTSALMTSFGIYFVTQQVTRPILAITNIAAQVADGDFSQTAPVLTEDEIGTLAQSFNTMTSQLRDLIGTLEQRVAERTKHLERRAVQLQAAAEVGHAAATLRDMGELLSQVTHLISERFGFYHIGVFLLDTSGEYAVLQAANSKGGQKMLTRGHRLKVGEVGIVGYVTAQQEARIALDVGTDAVFFDNPDLPETRSEMALPLIIGGELLGAIDVQSKREAAFSDEDINVLQILADQIAIAIENARLFTEHDEALKTARRAYSELSQEAWGELLRTQPELGFISTLARDTYKA